MFGTAGITPAAVYTAPHRTAYKNCGGPLHERIPAVLRFCGLRNISFCRPVFKAAADTKRLGYRAFYISHPKMRSLRRNTPYSVPMGIDARRAPLRMMFTARVRRCVLGTVSRESEPVDRADQRHILGRNLKVEHLSVCLYPVRMHGLRQRITRSEEQTGYRAVRRTCRICPRSPQDVHLREPRRIRAGSSFDRDSGARGISSRSQAVYIPDEILSDLRKVQPRLSQGARQGGAARNSTRRARGSCPRGKPPSNPRHVDALISFQSGDIFATQGQWIR